MSNTFTAIAACDAQSGIGIENRLPWKLPEDMQRFKDLTTGHVVIMGRRTFESMNCRPLKNRFNIVVSASAPKEPIDKNTTMFVTSIHNAKTFAHLVAGNDAEIFVIGGEGIYNAFLNFGYLHRVLLTQINKTFECDTKFPPLKSTEWSEVSREQHANNEFEYAFVEYKRIEP